MLVPEDATDCGLRTTDYGRMVPEKTVVPERAVDGDAKLLDLLPHHCPLGIAPAPLAPGSTVEAAVGLSFDEGERRREEGGEGGGRTEGLGLRGLRVELWRVYRPTRPQRSLRYSRGLCWYQVTVGYSLSFAEGSPVFGGSALPSVLGPRSAMSSTNVGYAATRSAVLARVSGYALLGTETSDAGTRVLALLASGHGHDARVSLRTTLRTVPPVACYRASGTASVLVCSMQYAETHAPTQYAVLYAASPASELICAMRLPGTPSSP
eukprot:2886689-Rhodomonas_salina.1